MAMKISRVKKDCEDITWSEREIIRLILLSWTILDIFINVFIYIQNVVDYYVEMLLNMLYNFLKYYYLYRLIFY